MFSLQPPRHISTLPLSALPPIATKPRTSSEVAEGPCVDGSELARAFFTSAVLVGAAMCSASISAVHVTAGHNAQLEKNVGARRFSEIIQEFSTKLDKDTEVLFYYAGHGLQFRGENFLVGIDTQLNREATLQFETFKLNTILNLLEQRASTTLLFWDACRDNPLADELLRSIPSSASGTSQLVRGGAAALPPRRGDTLIVFSAEPGKTALDGSGDFSPFAIASSQHRNPQCRNQVDAQACVRGSA